MIWWMVVLYLAAGVALLYYGAEWLVKGGVCIASKLGVPSLIIGLTLVSFATSAPELVVSIKAALADNGDISIGNVVGSNICNIGLILGLSSLITPLIVQKQLLRFDVPVLIILTLLFSGLGIGLGGFNRLTGILFVLLLLGYIGWNIHCSRKNDNQEGGDEVKEALAHPVSLAVSIGLVIAGLFALVGGGHLLVEGAVAIGKSLGIRDAVIGLTIVAIGTSLPELATSVVAAFRKEADIAIGNVIGSNIFNILAIMGIAPVIRPVRAVSINGMDWGTMIVLTLLLYPIMRTGWKVSRKEGMIFFLIFIAYMTWLVYSAK